MDRFYTGYNNVMNSATLNLNQLLANQYVNTFIMLMIILYAGLAAPSLPKPIAKLFDFNIFKILILALILYINNFSPSIAILMSVAFFITLQTISKYKVIEKAREFVAKRVMDQEEEDEMSSEDGLPDGKMNQGEVDFGLNLETQVSGLSARAHDYMGPQGMKHPVGYGGMVTGAQLF